MFDGSHYPIEENVAKTKELVAAAHDKGISIEAEVGSIGGEEDGVVGMGECADPKECKEIADLGIDFLAAGIGNIHGKYPENWQRHLVVLVQILPHGLCKAVDIACDIHQRRFSLKAGKRIAVPHVGMDKPSLSRRRALVRERISVAGSRIAVITL